MKIDGRDCGYLDVEGVACSEMRASFLTACGKLAHKATEMDDCMKYHARWAVSACYPKEKDNADEIIRKTKIWCHRNGIS